MGTRCALPSDGDSRDHVDEGKCRDPRNPAGIKLPKAQTSTIIGLLHRLRGVAPGTPVAVLIAAASPSEEGTAVAYRGTTSADAVAGSPGNGAWRRSHPIRQLPKNVPWSQIRPIDGGGFGGGLAPSHVTLETLPIPSYTK